jgi:hypothetical protein
MTKLSLAALLALFATANASEHGAAGDHKKDEKKAEVKADAKKEAC